MTLSCLLHGMVFFCTSGALDLPGTWPIGREAVLEQRYHPNRLAVSLGTTKEMMSTDASFTYDQLNESPQPVEIQEPDFQTPEERLPNTQERVYLDFELETQAEPVSSPDLEENLSPPDDEEGKMQLLLLISVNGDVLWTYVETTELSDKTSRLLAERFRYTRFRPGKIDQKPVASLYRIEVSVVRSGSTH